METIWQTLPFTFEGEQRTAKVTISSNPDVEVAYRVILDDGYENEFFIPDDADVWCEKTLGFTNLAEIVGEAIENHFE